MDIMDRTLGELLAFLFFLYCVGMVSIAISYFTDSKNGIDRRFFKRESENDFVNFFGIPIIIGLVVVACLAILASPFLVFL